MSSQNILLNPGVPMESKPSVHTEPSHERTPAWRFHPDFPNRLCKTDAELDRLDAEGWVDHPGKARRLTGHEKLWEAYQASLAKKDVVETVVEAPVDLPKTEDQLRADALKAESDRIEAKRLKDEKEKEEKRLADYEASKNPPGPRLCTLCGKEFDSIKALNMHGIAVHRNK
jgi:hypothetical protein